jgi:hypothetical protein
VQPNSSALSSTLPFDFKTHHAASILPMMSEEDFAALKEDIRQRGQQDDISMFQGQILDGRDRYRACRELGIEPQWCEVEKCEDPIAYVLSKNLYRRHLTLSQRAQCAADVAKMREGRPSKETSQTCLVSIDDAAKAFSVSPSSVKTAKHVADKGDRAVVDAVKAGEISVSAAAKLVDAVPDKKEQKKIVKKGKKAIAAAAKAKTPTDVPAIVAALDVPSLRSAADENAVAYIRRVLADGLLHPARKVFKELNKPEFQTRAFINESPSSADQAERKAIYDKATHGEGNLFGLLYRGQEIIETTLHAMVWLGLVRQDGDGEHTAYRWIGSEPAVPAAAELQP